MKVVIGMFLQESNSFSPIRCDIELIKKKILLYEEDIITFFKGTPTQIGAFLDVLKNENADVIPSIAARSESSGPLTEEAYKEIESTFLKTIKANWPIDGVLLCLHGATIIEGYPDGTGRFLERIRQEVGDKVVIAGTLDLHANVTEKMITSADVLIGYRTYPHVDGYEVGYATASLLVRTIKRDIKPVMAMCKMPMMHQAEACKTGEYPFKKIIDKVIEIEAKEEALSASVFQMQPWMDVEDAGASVIVIADGNEEVASAYAKSLAKAYWDIKEELFFELTPLEKAVDRAVNIDKGPVVISDSADSPSAGAPGDSTIVLDYLLKNNINVDTVLTMVDARAVEKAIELGVGQDAEFSLGGKIGEYCKPIKVRGTIKLISDGEYVQQRKNDKGIVACSGRTAVVKTGKIAIVVMENTYRAYEPAMYRSLGLEPESFKLVVVKSALNFREMYEDIAKEMYVVDTPGSSSANLQAMPFKNLRRPMYPFDEIKSYDIGLHALGHRRL